MLWGLPICYAVMLVGGLTVALPLLTSSGSIGRGLGPGQQAGFAVGAGIACVGSVAALVFAIWFIVLLFSYRRAFQIAAQEATEWQGAGGGTAGYPR